MPPRQKRRAEEAADPRAACLRSQHVEPPGGAAAEPDAKTGLRMVHGSRHVRVVGGCEGDWPASTDQWCWHCCHPFQGQPLPMPIGYDDRRKVFHVTGTFCGWACMKAHNMASSSYMKSIHANHISLFHWRCTGKLRGIRCAPPRQALRVFGGRMSIQEFRDAGNTDVEYCLLPPRMVLHEHVVHEQKMSSRRSWQTATNKRAVPDLAQVVSFKDVNTKNETLRLKRSKPLQSNRNLLERTMGIGALVQTL